MKKEINYVTKLTFVYLEDCEVKENTISTNILWPDYYEAKEYLVSMYGTGVILAYATVERHTYEYRYSIHNPVHNVEEINCEYLNI